MTHILNPERWFCWSKN